ncbi:ABC transporter substrate-binding protein [Persicobacter sp. CCB-QB2]|uniref:ABC transporter substrate-binding protein n=1 Tax=Persicobacter sp. CCB-QB2 TaxID=1561025 RepID=UPI0006A96873|nr:ABC transporter substrate-binding protein [Persicobacter sp. CCB-QB2]
MKKLYFLALTILTFFNGAALAQKKSNQETLQRGKDFYKIRKYAMAMEVLRPLTDSEDANMEAYGQFYYGLSAYEAGQKEVARNMFRQLVTEHPNWKSIDEGRFWLGKCYLEEENYPSAFANFAKLKSTTIQEQAQAYALIQLQEKDVFTLQGLQQRFPGEKAVAEALANQIYAQPINQQDRPLLAQLITEYQLNPENYAASNLRKSERKDVYHIAVMLPFRLDTTHYNNRKDFVWELFEGLEMAQGRLKGMGINVELHAYDTKKKAEITAQILEQPEIKSMDLIIGPLYPGPSKEVSDFCFEHQINMVNPVSQNEKVIGDNPFSFLYQPTPKTQAIAAANFMVQRTDTLNRNAMIVYMDNAADSTMAYQYKKIVEENATYQVNHLLKLKKGKEQEALNFFTQKEEVPIADSLLVNILEENPDAPTTEELFVIRPDSLDHVFVASENKALAANMLSALTTRNDQVSLLGMASWMQDKQIPLDAMARLNAYLIAPTYIETNSAQYDRFSDRYVKQANRFPSRFVDLGYETLICFGQMMAKYGNLPQQEMEDQVIKGVLTDQNLFYLSNDNQVVPILHFQDGELILADDGVVKAIIEE